MSPEIDDEFIERVEDELGMGHGAWDMEDPVEICKAVLKVAAAGGNRQEPQK